MKEQPWIQRTAMLRKTQDPLKGAFPDEGFADDEDFLYASGFSVRKVQV
jgi:hypothetical protein